jgi:hypothetical protein
MTCTEHHMQRMAAAPTRVILPDGPHAVMPLPSLVDRAHRRGLSIDYPPPGGPGWATTRDKTDRLAAWFEGGAA